MLANEFNEKENIWNRLQEPKRHAKSPAMYLLLLAALDTGWQVLEPVRLSLAREPGEGPVYHFLLHRGLSTEIRLLTIPCDQEINHYIKDEGLQVATGNLSQFTGMPLYLS
jgi:hypothetical protein